MKRTFLIRIYGALMRLHPSHFRAMFAVEMQSVFAALLDDVPRSQFRRLWVLCLREFVGLLGSLIREYWELTMQLNLRRRIVLAMLLIFAVSGGTLSIALQRASPGPERQAITGLAIGHPDRPGGRVYISGRRLDCVPTEVDGFAERCTLLVAGAPLEILARRNGSESSMQLSGECRAVYAGETWPCRIGSRHVHVHWFAYISEPLGLSEGAMTDLRQQYRLENLAEQPFLWSVLLVPVSTALLAAGAMVLWFWERRGVLALCGVLALSMLAGAITWFMMLIATLRLTEGFWD